MKTTTTIAAINEIMLHNAEVSATNNFIADNNLAHAYVRDTEMGLSGKSDYRMMYSAQRDEDKWTVGSKLFFADSRKLNYEEQRITELLESLKAQYSELKKFRSYLVSRVSYDTCTSFFSVSGQMKALRSQIATETANLEAARNWKPEAIVKKGFKQFHESYVSKTQRHERLEKAFYYRLKLEDELDIAPINNPFSLKDELQMIKVTGFEFRKPYLIISAVNAEDEFSRTHYTRSLDETSEFYFTFKVAFTAEGKEHPDMSRLRKWIWKKVSHTGNDTLASLLQQLIGRTTEISTNPESVDYLGFPTWDYSDKIEVQFNRNDKDYVGLYSNVHISSRSIEEEHGDIRFVKTSDSIDVYSGDKFLRSYKIHEA